MVKLLPSKQATRVRFPSPASAKALISSLLRQAFPLAQRLSPNPPQKNKTSSTLNTPI